MRNLAESTTLAPRISGVSPEGDRPRQPTHARLQDTYWLAGSTSQSSIPLSYLLGCRLSHLLGYLLSHFESILKEILAIQAVCHCQCCLLLHQVSHVGRVEAKLVEK